MLFNFRKSVKSGIKLQLYFHQGTHSKTKEIIITTGETALLHCENTPGNTVTQWRRLVSSKNKSKITYTDGWITNEDLEHKDRITIPSSVHNDSYDLQITNTTTSDSGVYQCVAVIRNRPTVIDVKLTVKGNHKYTG